MADEKKQVEEKKANMFVRFLKASPDSIGKTVFVAVIVCLFASMVVSSAAVSLRPTQESNKAKDKKVNVLQVAKNL